MKLLCVALTIAALAGSALGASVIQNGNFQGATGVTNTLTYRAGVSPNGQWIGHTKYAWATGGRTGSSDRFARHTEWTNVKLLQGVTVAGTGLTNGASVRLTFDHILQNASAANVRVVGLASGQKIETWGNGAIEGVTLLAPKNLSASSNWVTGTSFDFTVNGNFHTIAVVYEISGPTDGIRGIDNVSMSVISGTTPPPINGAVPEPITMAGLTMGVIGLAGYIRRRRS